MTVKISTPVVIEGRYLEVGEVIQKNDYYLSSSGTWQLAPCPGLKVHAAPPGSQEVQWFRPEWAEGEES